LPPLQLEFEIVLQDDNEMILQNDGTGRRVVVQKFELWDSKLLLSSEGQKVVNENFLKPTDWRYLKRYTPALADVMRGGGGGGGGGLLVQDHPNS